MTHTEKEKMTKTKMREEIERTIAPYVFDERLLEIMVADLEELFHTRLEGIVRELDKRLKEDHLYKSNVTEQDEKEDPLGSQYLLGKEGGYIQCIEDIKSLLNDQKGENNDTE